MLPEQGERREARTAPPAPVCEIAAKNFFAKTMQETSRFTGVLALFPDDGKRFLRSLREVWHGLCIGAMTGVFDRSAGTAWHAFNQPN